MHFVADSFKAKCKELGVNYWRALKRREAGLPDEKIFAEGYIRNSRRIGEITVFGVTYPNLREAVRALNPPAPRETIGRWIREGMKPEEAFERIPNPGYADGIIYLVTHRESDRRYVGLTIQALERRWWYHVNQASAGYIKGADSLHAAIREFGPDAFEVRQIDQGTCKKDLEAKERQWIANLNTLAPSGFNIATGGNSGGCHKKPVTFDGKTFESTGQAAAYISKTLGISLDAAKKRLSVGRVNVRTPAKPGQSVVKSKAYKAWSHIIHGALSPKSKDYVPGISIYEPWRSFDQFLQDVGQPLADGMVFTRLDKSKGFYPDNCSWLTKSEACRLNAKGQKRSA